MDHNLFLLSQCKVILEGCGHHIEYQSYVLPLLLEYNLSKIQTLIISSLKVSELVSQEHWVTKININCRYIKELASNLKSLSMKMEETGLEPKRGKKCPTHTFSAGSEEPLVTINACVNINCIGIS